MERQWNCMSIILTLNDNNKDLTDQEAKLYIKTFCLVLYGEKQTGKAGAIIFLLVLADQTRRLKTNDHIFMCSCMVALAGQ